MSRLDTRHRPLWAQHYKVLGFTYVICNSLMYYCSRLDWSELSWRPQRPPWLEHRPCKKRAGPVLWEQGWLQGQLAALETSRGLFQPGSSCDLRSDCHPLDRTLIGHLPPCPRQDSHPPPQSTPLQPN